MKNVLLFVLLLVVGFGAFYVAKNVHGFGAGVPGSKDDLIAKQEEKEAAEDDCRDRCKSRYKWIRFHMRHKCMKGCAK